MKTVFAMSLVLVLALVMTRNAAANGYHTSDPCANIGHQVVIDTAIGAVAGALLGGRHGVRYGAGVGLVGSFALRQAQCEQYRQQMYYEVQQNVPRCQYWEQNGVQYRSCTETVYGNWRR